MEKIDANETKRILCVGYEAYNFRQLCQSFFKCTNIKYDYQNDTLSIINYK
jgi:hypothetical protein